MNPIPKRTLDQLTPLPLTELHPHPDDPFSVHDDDAMKELTESISSFGVLAPALVRPRKEGRYALLSGKCRKHAAEPSGKTNMPVINRDLDNDEAVILLMAANLHRPDIPPSEQAKAYKMKLEAIKHQGQRQKSISIQVVQKLSVDMIAKESRVSWENILRYIRLTELPTLLQQMVDDKIIAMTPAVELSYLKPCEQALLVKTIESEQATPSLSQAQRMKKLTQIGHLNEANLLDCSTIDYDYICTAANRKQIDEVIENMLEVMFTLDDQIRIGKQTYLTACVQSRARRITGDSILHVLDGFQDNTTFVHYARGYINSTGTMDRDYMIKVQHDYYG